MSNTSLDAGKLNNKLSSIQEQKEGNQENFDD
jgi:hypothetical protein